MADDVNEGIENALHTIVTTTESSGNMRKELKHATFRTVSTLRQLFVKLIDTYIKNSKVISDLEKLVANTKTELEEVKGRAAKDIVATSRIPTHKAARPIAKGVATSDGGNAKLYSEVLGGNTKHKRFKRTTTSKDNQPAEMDQRHAKIKN